jgi:hypothetical protein
MPVGPPADGTPTIWNGRRLVCDVVHLASKIAKSGNNNDYYCHPKSCSILCHRVLILISLKFTDGAAIVQVRSVIRAMPFAQGFEGVTCHFVSSISARALNREHNLRLWIVKRIPAGLARTLARKGCERRLGTGVHGSSSTQTA